MAYCTKQDLVDRGWEAELKQLTDKVNKPASTINDTTVEAHIADAASLIDTYLGKRYQLPIDPVPAVLRKVAADLSRYFLHGKVVDEKGSVAIAYRDGLAWLKDIARGTATMDGAGEVAAPAGGGQIKTSAANRVFTRHDLQGF